MYLTKEIAMEIIKEISPYINFDLNIMDGTGLILASTNSDRENTFHEGAQILIKEGLTSLIVRSDEEFAGCKKGVNLPISFLEQVIGVIGITGEPEEAIKHARILQKMTEMLIYENFDFAKKTNRESLNLLLINDLIYGVSQVPLSNIEERLIQSHLDINGPFTVTIFCPSIVSSGEGENGQLHIAKENIIKNLIRSQLEKKHMLCANNGEFYIAVSNYTLDRLTGILEDLQKMIYLNYNIEFVFFTGSECREYLDIPRAFKEALTVKQHLRSSQSGIFQFNSIVLDFIVSQVPAAHRNNLYDQVFNNCSPVETAEFREFIIMYFQCNGSLKQMAELNFAHKNTIQYKINKITKKTGFDLRKFEDLFILYLAASAM